MIIQYTRRLVIYNIDKMFENGNLYKPKEYSPPHDKFEKICDFYFRAGDENEI